MIHLWGSFFEILVALSGSKIDHDGKFEQLSYLNIYVELKYVRTIQADLNSRTVKVYLCQEAIMKDT